MKLNNYEMIEINGGASNISGSLISAVSSLINTVLSVGRAIGTALNMAITGKKC